MPAISFARAESWSSPSAMATVASTLYPSRSICLLVYPKERSVCMPVTSSRSERCLCAAMASIIERRRPYSARVPVTTSTVFLFFVVIFFDKVVLLYVAHRPLAEHIPVELGRKPALRALDCEVAFGQSLAFFYRCAGYDTF